MLNKTPEQMASFWTNLVTGRYLIRPPDRHRMFADLRDEKQDWVRCQHIEGGECKHDECIRASIEKTALINPGAPQPWQQDQWRYAERTRALINDLTNQVMALRAEKKKADYY